MGDTPMDPRKLAKGDFVVAVFGPTGVGKSRLISEMTGNPNIQVGHTLQSETREIKVYPMQLQGRKIYLVEIPGLDDTDGSNTEVFIEVASFLAEAYKHNWKLSGLVYMHRITDKRVGDIALRSLRLFKEIVGESAFSNVIFVTSMWDQVEETEGIRREQALIQNFWDLMLRHGVRHKRFYGDRQSAIKILELMNSGSGKALTIQKEVVDMELALVDTSAGRLLAHESRQMAETHELGMRLLRQEIEGAIRMEDEIFKEEIKSMHEEIQHPVQMTRNEEARLGMPRHDQFMEPRPGDQRTSAGYQKAVVFPRLQHNEIRLVELRAGEGNEPVEISLVVARFDTPLEYDALSYVVGVLDYSAFVNLRVRGRIMKFATSNVLETVLRQLRYGQRDRFMWVDALSINQNDLDERSREVRRMSQIFTKAQNVCIWLGPDADDSDLAIDFIPQVADFSMVDKYVRDVSKRTKWLALARLMGRRWFSRRWCVQEMALAQKATVHCGSRSVPWPEFADAAALFSTKWVEIVQLLAPNEAYEFGEVQVPGATSLVDISSRLLRNHHNGNVKERIYNLETLLAMLPMFEVTNILDSIYAIIDLASDTYKTSRIPIDYKLPPARLFQTVLEVVMSTSGSLDVICRPWAPICPLPSWISTVSNYPFVRRTDGQYDRQNGDSLVGGPSRRLYCAAGDTSVHGNVHFVDDAEIPLMRATGLQIGVIEAVGDRCINGNIPKNWMTLGGWPDRSQPAPSTFWQTLVADRGPNRTNPPIWYAKACEYSFPKSYTPDVDIPKLMTLSQSTNVREFLEKVQTTTWNRTFLVMRSPPGLESPACFGVGPAQARDQDLVCILFGCSVPVIMRQSNAAFELIGECFIYGNMEGEAMRGLQMGKYTKQTFDIH